MQIIPINQNSNNYTFGAIKSTPEVLANRVAQLDRAIKLIYQQDKNKAADIVIEDNLTKVVAKDGFMLTHWLANSTEHLNCKSLIVDSVDCHDWEHAIASCTDENGNKCKLDVGVLSTEHLTGDEKIDAAEAIACDAHNWNSSQYEQLSRYYMRNNNALYYAIGKLLEHSETSKSADN